MMILKRVSILTSYGRHLPLERICAKGEACPYLSGKAVLPGFNDLASNYPELAKQWHPTRNGDLKPSDVTCGKNKKVFWYLPYDDPETGKHFDFEWEAWIRDRTRGAKCPYFTGNAVWTGYNDFATKHPELAKQWHPTKNENLKPTEIACNRHEAVWWLYPYDDPITGKHFDFEWRVSPNARITNSGCPFLTGKDVWKGFNDLESRYPEIAKQWHPTKNQGVCRVRLAMQVTRNSSGYILMMIQLRGGILILCGKQK